MPHKFNRRQLFAAGMVAAMTGHNGGYAADTARRLNSQLDGLLAQHETTLPAAQVEAAQALRAQAAQLLTRKMGPRALASVRQTAARSAAVEAAAGTFIWSDAESLTATAAANSLAVRAGDWPCVAFCCGVTSVIYRYAGHTPLAVRWAQTAAAQVPAGHPARATMAMHEARALAELPERNERQMRRVLDGAIDHAYNLPGDLIGTPGVNFDLVSPVEVEYGATIAYLRGRQSHAASQYFDSVAASIDVCAGPGKRAMLRVEQAISDALYGRMELDRSCALVGEALDIDPSWSGSLNLRLDEWVGRVGRHVGVREVRDTVGRIRAWQRAA